MPLTAAAALTSAAAPIVGGIIGNSNASGDRAAAQQAYEKALAQYTAIGIPTAQAQQLALQSPSVQGILNPQMQTAVSQGPNAMAGIQTDPRLAQAQMNALQSLQQTGQQGLTAVTQAQLDAANRQVNQNQQAHANAITQGLAQRGAAGGGLELAAQLENAQSGADQAGQQSDRTMAMAQQNMLNATSQAGQLGGQMQAQQFGQQSQIAQAQNAINQFNALQQAGVQQQNVQAANQAQAANLANKQSVANQGVATSNAQQQYNQQLQQQYLQNQLQLAGGISGQQQNYGNFMNQLGNSIAGQAQGIGAGIGQMASPASSLYKSFGSSSPSSNTSNPYANAPISAASGGPTGASNVYSGGPGRAQMLLAHGGVVPKPHVLDAFCGGGPVGAYSLGGEVGYAYGGQTGTSAPGQYDSSGKHMAEAGVTIPAFTGGGDVPGKAPVAGDSKKNDVVHALLSPGEVVIPRSHAMTEHLAKSYIEHLFGKKK